MKIKSLSAFLVSAWLAFAPAFAANQAPVQTPTTGPHSATDFTTNYLNPALLAIWSCNWGTAAPANGPGAAPGLFECWANTTANPVVFSFWDGAQWVNFGKLDTAAHTWIPVISGTLGTALPILSGGTGATTAASARTNLGLQIGLNVEAWDADLDCIAANSTAGLLTYTGAGTCASRTIAGTANEITVTNGVGTAGNPTISIPVAVTFTGKTITGGTYSSPAINTPTIAGGTHTAITGLGVRSTGASFDMRFATAEVLTADRILSWVLGDASRSITLGGNLSYGGAFTMSGAFGFTGTLTGTTAVTFPTAGTLATLAGTEVFTNKTFVCANQTSCVVRLGSDVTGTLLAANFPALTGDVTTSAGSLATAIAAAAVTNAKMANMNAATIKANATGGSAGPTDVAAAVARSSSLLNVDSFTGHGDSIYTILATDRTVGTNAAFTASRTWTLPAANGVNAGQEIVVADFQGTVTGVNTLVISRAGADTVNGGTAVTITAANGAYLLKSDGVSKWTAQALGAAAAGGVSSVTCGTGLSGGTITTSGTCAVSLSSLTQSLGADVLLNNTGSVFDIISVAQGTSGTWLATAQVAATDTAASVNIKCELWDGTTIIATGLALIPSAGGFNMIPLSGKITSPAGNIKVTCKDTATTTGVIKANGAGYGNSDSTLTVVRIQ